MGGAKKKNGIGGMLKLYYNLKCIKSKTNQDKEAILFSFILQYNVYPF